MMGVWRKAAICALLVALAGCGDDKLNGEELRAALSGNSAVGQTGDAHRYTVFFSASGAVHMAVENGFIDEGRWWVTAEDLYCRRWVRVDGGQEACFTVTRKGDDLTFTRGEELLTVSLVSGNPEQLPRLR